MRPAMVSISHIDFSNNHFKSLESTDRAHMCINSMSRRYVSSQLFEISHLDFIENHIMFIYLLIECILCINDQATFETRLRSP